MEYTLMHKTIPVLDMYLDEKTAYIQKIFDVFQPEHLPVGTTSKGRANRAELNTWWIGRSIPASRMGIQEALETLGISNTQVLLTKSFGLSLSDQYWVKPKDSNICWENINFFDNPFSEDIGDVLIGKIKDSRDLDFSSPDNTSDGFLRKRWKIINGKRCLCKGGSNPFQQQPFNEVVASMIAGTLNIPHVPYKLMWDNGVPYSVCEDFITADTELISAWRVFSSYKQDNNTSVYQHYVNCCNTLGVPDVRKSLDEMIVLDYLIANEDRHLNNFGLVRDANTLKWIGPAPIFDSGTSFGYDKLPGQIRVQQNIPCKPFKRTHVEQLGLVSSFDWINFGNLHNIVPRMEEIFMEGRDTMDESRVEAILSAFESRLQHLEQNMSSHQRKDNIAEDVHENIATKYR